MFLEVNDFYDAGEPAAYIANTRQLLFWYLRQGGCYAIALVCLSVSLPVCVQDSEPALEPPAPPGRGGLTILRGLMSQLVNFFTVHTPLRHIRVQFYSVQKKANHTMTQLLRAYRPTSKSVCLNNL